MVMSGLMLADIHCEGLNLASVCYWLTFTCIVLKFMILRRACLNKNVLHGLLKSAYKSAVLNCAKGCVEIVRLCFFVPFFFF